MVVFYFYFIEKMVLTTRLKYGIVVLSIRRYKMDIKKYRQLNKACQNEVETIYYDGYWNIVLKNYNRAISAETWSEAKWMLSQMVKHNDFTMEW